MSFALGLALGAWCFAGTAKADPTFPSFLQENYKTPCLPDCTLCHLTELGGVPNFKDAIKPDGTTVHYGFGGTLYYTFNITIGNPGPAFAADANYVDPMNPNAMKGYDTDGDGVPDMVEVANGTDPNNGTDVNASYCNDLKYGCVGGRVNPKGSVDGVASVASAAVLLLGLGLVRRRRR